MLKRYAMRVNICITKYLFIFPFENSDLGRPTEYSKYDNASTITLMKLFRRHSIKTKAYDELVQIINEPKFSPKDVAPTYYLASKVEEKTISRVVSLFVIFFF